MHYLFMLHGMGTHKTGWSSQSAKIIESNAARYSGMSKRALRKKVQIVELEYGTLLSRLMEQLLEDGESLGPVNDWLRGDSTGGLSGFVRDSALDVTAYIWHSDTFVYVLDTIAEKMLEIIKPKPISNRFSLLCHSLGTKVGFDLLQLLYADDDTRGGDADTLDELSPLFKLRRNRDAGPRSPRFSNLYLVANVMPLLNEADMQTYWAGDTHVRVRRTRHPVRGGVITENYRIFNNHYDPFARIGRTHHIPADMYNDLVILAQAHEWNMHSLGHYLNHPSVHIPIVEDMYGIEVPDKQKFIEDYDKDHHDSAKEAALDSALRVVKEFEGVDPPGLTEYFAELAKLLPSGIIGGDDDANQ